jgi:hypothetical protein
MCTFVRAESVCAFVRAESVCTFVRAESVCTFVRAESQTISAIMLTQNQVVCGSLVCAHVTWDAYRHANFAHPLLHGSGQPRELFVINLRHPVYTHTQ